MTLKKHPNFYKLEQRI